MRSFICPACGDLVLISENLEKEKQIFFEMHPMATEEDLKNAVGICEECAENFLEWIKGQVIGTG